MNWKVVLAFLLISSPATAGLVLPETPIEINQFSSMLNAIESNDVSTVNRLLSEHINVNLTEDSRAGPTFITQAALKGRIDILKLLIEHGSDIETINGDGFTALMCAILENHEDVALFLIGIHADVNAISNSGESTISLAKKINNQNIVNALIKAGAKE